MVVLKEANKFLCPKSFEPLLNLGEYQLYRIVLGAICWAVNVSKAKFLHAILGLVRRVDGQVVHQQTNLIITVGRPHGVQPLLELCHVDRPGKDHVMLLALFL